MNDRERVRGAVGLIETEGLPAAIAAADAALKAANVVLVGRENSRGGGFMTVKIAGDVAAVQAALAAARVAAEGVRGVRSVLAIPRPAEGIGDRLVRNGNTMGAELLRPALAPCGAEGASDAAGEGLESEAERAAELPKEGRAPRSGEAGLAVAGPRALMKVQPAAPAETGDSTTVEVAGGAEAGEAAPEPAEDEAKKPRKRRSAARRKPR